MTSSRAETLLTGDALLEALQEVVQDAERRLAGVHAAGAAVHQGPSHTLAASNPVAAAVDGSQYEMGDGPCLHAFRTNAVVVLDLDGRTQRWPRFQAAALAWGLRTVLAVPLRVEGAAFGSLNLYSRSLGAFSARLVREAELFARPAGLRLLRTGVALHAAEAAEIVGLELQDRTTIDLALGVLMEVHQDPSVERARLRLEEAANELGLDVPLAAARLVAAPPPPKRDR
jgi:GAF domain-containing protein